VVGIEVKATTSPGSDSAKHLRWLRDRLGERFTPAWSFTSAILVILLMIQLRVFEGPGAATGNPWLLGIGLAIFVLGLPLAVWARVYLGRNWAMPMSQKADPELVTTVGISWLVLTRASSARPPKLVS
jgi:protein-S-isoprenylcysteine O-methyltransferase Ste14